MVRDRVVDVAKGIAIILMIIGHCGFLFPWNSYGTKLIFAFHMPLFFMVSGFCTSNPSKPFNFAKQFQSLVVPYIVVSTIRILIVYSKSILLHRELNTNVLISAIYGAGSPITVLGFDIDWNSPLWFLLCLFFSKMIFSFVMRNVQEKWHSLTFCILAALGLIIGKYLWLPFSFCPAMFSALFIYIGYCIKRYDILERTSKTYFGIIELGILLSAVCLPTFSLESLSIHYPVFQTLIAVSGTLLTFRLSKFLYNKNFFSFVEFCGIISLTILGVHTCEQVVSPFESVLLYIKGGIITASVLAVVRVMITVTLSYVYLRIKRKFL